MKAPNLEVAKVLRKWIEDDLDESFRPDRSLTRRVWEEMRQGSYSNLQRALQAAIADVSYFALNPHECVYGVFLGTLLRFGTDSGEKWELRYESEVADGRVSLATWQKNGSHAIVIELKRAETPKESHKGIDHALKDLAR